MRVVRERHVQLSGSEALEAVQRRAVDEAVLAARRSTRSTPKNVRSVCIACCPISVGMSTSTPMQAGKSAARGGRPANSPTATMAMNGSGVVSSPRRAQADHRGEQRRADPQRALELGSPGEVARTRSREVRSQHERRDDRDRVLEDRREDDRRDERGENAAADAADGEQQVVLGQVLRGRTLECDTPVHEQRDEEEVHDVHRRRAARSGARRRGSTQRRGSP